MASTGATRLARSARDDGRATRDDEPEDDAEHDAPTTDHHRTFRRLEAHALGDAEHGPADGGTGQGTHDGTDETEHDRLTEHKATHLPRRCAKGAEETQLADALSDQHRERVDDDEPADNHAEAGEQRDELREEPDARRPRGIVRPDHLRPPAERAIKGGDRGLQFPLRIEGDEDRVEARRTGEQAGGVAWVEQGQAAEAQRLAVRRLAHARHGEVLDRPVRDDPDGAPDVDTGPLGGAPVEHDLPGRGCRPLSELHRRHTRIVDPRHTDRRAEAAERRRAVRCDDDGLAGHGAGRGRDAVERPHLIEDHGGETRSAAGTVERCRRAHHDICGTRRRDRSQQRPKRVGEDEAADGERHAEHDGKARGDVAPESVAQPTTHQQLHRRLGHGGTVRP